MKASIKIFKSKNEGELEKEVENFLASAEVFKKNNPHQTIVTYNDGIYVATVNYIKARDPLQVTYS